MGRTSPFRCEGVKVQNRRSAADTPVSGGWLKLPPHLPFARPLGIGSIGWNADLRGDGIAG